jgi:hypothetical protein
MAVLWWMLLSRWKHPPRAACADMYPAAARFEIKSSNNRSANHFRRVPPAIDVQGIPYTRAGLTRWRARVLRLRHLRIFHACDRETVLFRGPAGLGASISDIWHFRRRISGTSTWWNRHGAFRRYPRTEAHVYTQRPPDGDFNTADWVCAYLSVDLRRRPAAAAHDAGNAGSRKRWRSARGLGIRCRARPARAGWICRRFAHQGLISYGILLGSLVATAVDMTFSQAQIAGGLWRLPFLIGGLFGSVAMLLRRWLEETPVFEEMRKRATISRELPLRAVLQRHRRAITVSVLTTWMLTAAIVVVILMTPALLQDMFRLTSGAVQPGNLAGTAGCVFPPSQQALPRIGSVSAASPFQYCCY